MLSDSALKCLLVDDEEPMLQMLAQYVELFGFKPVIAHDGDEGIAAFRACHPSLVVSDLHMPNRNGLLLLRDIKQMNPACPVILITGVLHDYRVAISSNPVHPDVLIEKPFPLAKLRQAIEDLTPAIQKAWDKIDKSDELS
jgi:DNA-binding NtrC family response regulator